MSCSARQQAGLRSHTHTRICCRRNKEVREKADAAEEEREMLKHMNEEERRQWERDNPKEVRSQANWQLQSF